MADFQVGIFVRSSSAAGSGGVQIRPDYVIDIDAADADSGGKRFVRENLSDGLYRVIVGNRAVFIERHDVLRIEVYPRPQAG